jgi:hypothetical protein
MGVIFKNLFRPKWRHADPQIGLAAVAKFKSRRKLRKIAEQAADERIRLEAARRLEDHGLLRVLALSAVLESVRMDAAIEVDNPACLTAIALDTWEIQLGQKCVQHVHHPLLLRRVARSARQDAIRLAAALKLGDDALLRLVAQSSTHIDIHWQVARYLDDPCMLADIALFKPGNMRLEPLRREARRTLTAYLNRCQRKGNHQALQAVIRSVSNPGFKIKAFNRLSEEFIDGPLLEYMAAQDLRYIPNEELDQMLTVIHSSGWRLDISIQHTACIYCRGKGELSLKCISTNDTWSDRDVFACPDCKGLGQTPFRQVVCNRSDGEQVILRFPA